MSELNPSKKTIDIVTEILKICAVLHVNPMDFADREVNSRAENA